MKYVVIALLLAIVVSLAEAMFFLARDNGTRDKNRVAKALTLRVGLSFALFALVMAGAYFGLFEPHGVQP